MKIKIAQYSLTGCEGCAVSLINALAQNLELLNIIEIVTSRIIGHPEIKEADITFVDGAVVTEHDLKLLNEIRKKSKVIVALGTCATLSGLCSLKDLYDQHELEKHVYGIRLPITHLDNAKPITEVIKVDYQLPGCPSFVSEIDQFMKNIILNKSFKLPEGPVCFECKAKGLPCLLDIGKTCLGPITRRGCGAQCIEYGMPCWGCRGPVDELRIDQFLESVKKHNVDLKELLKTMEIYLLKTNIISTVGDKLEVK